MRAIAHAATVALGQGVAAIAWERPWFSPYSSVGRPIAQKVLAGMTMHDALNEAAATVASAVRFVAQSTLPAGVAYESYVFETRQVPTRENLHDFFNALVWLKAPTLKAQLNALHAREIKARGGVGAQRGALRDRLTLIDESGAWLSAPRALQEALMRRDWHALFTEHRHCWAQGTLRIVGHALLEKLLCPRKALCAHVFFPSRASMPAKGAGAQAEARPNDAAPSGRLFPEAWTPEGLQAIEDKKLYPLPVLGVPGWWAENENPVFYRDASVFRS